MSKELKRFEQWWDAEDDIPNNGPYTPDTPIQFAWAGWQAALAEQPVNQLDDIDVVDMPAQKRPQNCGTGYCSCIECVMEPAQQEPTSGDYALGYAEGFNDACKPAQQEPVPWSQALEDVWARALHLEDAWAEPDEVSQPAQQEPVAWRWSESGGVRWFDWTTDWSHYDRAKAMGFPIQYAAPQPAQRTWVGLSDEDVMSIAFNFDVSSLSLVAKAIEAKLKELNT